MQEEFEDTKGVVRIRKSKRSRKHNVQKKKYKSMYNVQDHSVPYNNAVLP